MTRKWDMARNRARMPQDEGKNGRSTAIISARVDQSVKELVVHAAAIRAWPEARIVEEGSKARALEILEQAGGHVAAYRRQTRQGVARLGGLAKAAKARVGGLARSRKRST